MTGLFSQPQDVYECKLSQCWCQDYKNVSCVNVSYRETNVYPTACTNGTHSYPNCNYCSHSCQRNCCYNTTNSSFKFKKSDYKDTQKGLDFDDNDDDDGLKDGCYCQNYHDCRCKETGQNYPSNFNLGAVSTNDNLTENYHESRTFSFKRFHTEKSCSCKSCCSTSTDAENNTIFLPSCGDYIYNNPKCKSSTLYGLANCADSFKFDSDAKSNKSSKCRVVEDDKKLPAAEKTIAKTEVELKPRKLRKKKSSGKVCFCEDTTENETKNVSKSSKHLKRSWTNIKDVCSEQDQKDIPNKKRRNKSRKRSTRGDKKGQNFVVFPCMMPNIKIVSEEAKTANKDCICDEKNFKKYLKTIEFKDVTKYYLCHSLKNSTDSNLICKCSRDDLAKSGQYTQYEGNQPEETENTNIFLEQSKKFSRVSGNEIELMNVIPSKHSKFSSVLAQEPEPNSLQGTLTPVSEIASGKSVKISLLSHRSAQTMKPCSQCLSETSFNPVATSSGHSGINASPKVQPYVDVDVQTSTIGSNRSTTSKSNRSAASKSYRSTDSKTPSTNYSMTNSDGSDYSKSKKPSLVSGDPENSITSQGTDRSTAKSYRSANPEIRSQNTPSFVSRNSTRNSVSGSTGSNRTGLPSFVSENSTFDSSVVRSTNTYPEMVSVRSTNTVPEEPSLRSANTNTERVSIRSAGTYPESLSVRTNTIPESQSMRSANANREMLSITTYPYPDRPSITSQQYMDDSTIASNRYPYSGTPSATSKISKATTKSNRSKAPSAISSYRSGSISRSTASKSYKSDASERPFIVSETLRSYQSNPSQRTYLASEKSTRSNGSRRASYNSKSYNPTSDLTEVEQEYPPVEETSSIDYIYDDETPRAPQNSLNEEAEEDEDDDIFAKSKESRSQKRYSVTLRDENTYYSDSSVYLQPNDSKLYCYKPVIVCKCETPRSVPRCSITYFSRIEVVVISIFMVLAWWFTLRHI